MKTKNIDESGQKWIKLGIEYIYNFLLRSKYFPPKIMSPQNIPDYWIFLIFFSLLFKCV